MITVTSMDLNSWIGAFIWPLTRILGMFTMAPLFGNSAVPNTVKIGLGVLLAVIISPTLTGLPTVDPMSLAGIVIIIQQIIIGIAIGFMMRLIFSAIELSGEVIGLTMGLGFATFFDPQSQGRTSVINQLLTLLALLIFVTANFHLLMISALFESFITMPIGLASLGTTALEQMIYWAAYIFSTSLQLSMPIIGILLATNAAMGILTKAAPQLNLFAVGFPITLSIGMMAIGIILPYMTQPLLIAFENGIQEIQKTTTVVKKPKLINIIK
jgi:flagellar biosynthetic protein FliR